GGSVAEVLGAALETATDGGRRRAQGLHVTPAWLAGHLVGLALDGLGPGAGPGGAPAMCDPACGGGVFLVAAAERLHACGIPRAEVVRDLVWGADIDPVGLAAAEAALALWAGEAPPPGRLVVGDPLVHGAGVWPDRPAAGFDAVIGNPPFQNQLGRATARSAADQGRLRERFGPAVRPYTDTAWLFLLVGCELVRPGGRVALVEPRSLIAARDAEALRAALDRCADLRRLWVDDGPVFAAAVRVCVPVLERRPDAAEAAGEAGPAEEAGEAGPAEPRDGDGPHRPGPARPRGAGSGGAGDGGAGDGEPPAPDAAARPGPSDRWRGLWADAVGVPRLPAWAAPTLGERATVVAGFRDEYYGLVGAVREHDPADPPGAVAPLVTSGVIDWCASSWGRRPVRYAKLRWQAPVVDLGRLASLPSSAARRWVARTRRPKVVVATQTRVVEAVVDADGDWVPSVPTVAVLPREDAGEGTDLWHILAVLASPAATAWLLRRAAGTALGVRALRVAAPDLAALPLPADTVAWDDAAAALRAAVDGHGPEAAAGHGPEAAAAAVDHYLVAVGAAYGTDAALAAWWREQAGGPFGSATGGRVR
ncbi:MAG TPA: N-6 DNA methylase, partial [Acidimicrobiales bacterium]|nr:N-6 DNA methylase [Acidimicrobiales bacterium]